MPAGRLAATKSRGSHPARSRADARHVGRPSPHTPNGWQQCPIKPVTACHKVRRCVRAAQLRGRAPTRRSSPPGCAVAAQSSPAHTPGVRGHIPPLQQGGPLRGLAVQLRAGCGASHRSIRPRSPVNASWRAPRATPQNQNRMRCRGSPAVPAARKASPCAGDALPRPRHNCRAGPAISARGDWQPQTQRRRPPERPLQPHIFHSRCTGQRETDTTANLRSPQRLPRAIPARLWPLVSNRGHRFSLHSDTAPATVKPAWLLRSPP